MDEENYLTLVTEVRNAMDTAHFLYFYKIDVKERVLSRFQQKIQKKFKPEALKKISLEIIENTVDKALSGYQVTTVDLALAVKHTDVLCVKCGECCRRPDPITVETDDVTLIASFREEDYQSIIINYSKQLEDGTLSLRTPCPFLHDNRCSIYPARPKVCRLFPFIVQGSHVTMGIQPYCMFPINLLIEKAFGFLIVELIERDAPHLISAMKTYAKNLGKNVPSKQPQQLSFFKQWINNKHRDSTYWETYETFSQYVFNLFEVTDFLLPNESIQYQSPTQLSLNDELYTLYLTNLRFIAHHRSGLWLFPKDRIIDERLDNIQHISYKEKRFFSKKGVLTLETRENKLLFEGNASDVKPIWQAIHQYI